MPERVTIEEKITELAILKAKEVKDLLQDAGVNTFEINEPLSGEEVKVKKPQKNPKEEKLSNPIDKDTGYGLAGQVNDYAIKKMQTIHKRLTKILKDIYANNLDSDELDTFSNQIGRKGSKWGRGIVQRLNILDKEMSKLTNDFTNQKINQDVFRTKFHKKYIELGQLMEIDTQKGQQQE